MENSKADVVAFSLILLPLGLSVIGVPVGMSFTIGAIVCVVGLLSKD